MLISLRDKKNKLVIKDILDIDFDMFVEKKENKFYIAVNRRYYYNEVFPTQSDAECKMLEIADSRNVLENELKNY